MGARVEILWPQAAPGKARPRATYIQQLGRTQIYTPDKTAREEAALQIWARDAMAGREPFTGPLRLSVQCVYACPKSWSGKKKARETGGPKTSKPDLDNVVKLIKDALNGIVWTDDQQVAQLGETGKWWGARDMVRIVVEPAQPTMLGRDAPGCGAVERMQGALL